MIEKDQIIDGKYRIVDLIGTGGMGAVYEGENILIHRRVAIKVLHANASKNTQAVERFQREAQAAGRIGNDHILEVIDLGKLEGGENFMVMEYLDGETLGSRIVRAGGLPPRAAVPLIRQALLGLKAAHAVGIVHRDLKPENIFICRQKAGQVDFVKLIDFGVSKFSPTATDMAMTRTGAVMGTPYYMSPEQARGTRDIDHRSDLYTMGVILYEAVTGKVPFAAETFNELMFKIALSEPPPLRQLRPEVDEAFAAITQKAMAREAAERFQSADEFIQALDTWLGSGAFDVPAALAGGPAAAVTAELHPASPPTGASAWANTQTVGTAPKSRGALVAVAAAVGVIGLVALALVVWKVRASRAAAAPAASIDVPVEVFEAHSAAPVEPPPPSAAASVEETAEPNSSAAPPPDAPATEAKGESPRVAGSAKPGATKGAPAASEKPKPSEQKKPQDWGY